MINSTQFIIISILTTILIITAIASLSNNNDTSKSKEKVQGIELKKTFWSPIKLWAYCEIKENHLNNCKERNGASIGNHPYTIREYPQPFINKTEPISNYNRSGIEFKFLDNTLEPIKPEKIVWLQSVSSIPKNKLCIKNEPSTASNGTHIIYTGNHYAAISSDRGLNWNFIDPNNPPDILTKKGFPFCCDQRVIYDKTRELFIWLIIGEDLRPKPGSWSDINPVRLAVSKNLSTWGVYHFTATNIDDNFNVQFMDFPKLSISKDFLYVTSNAFYFEGNKNSGSVILQISLDELNQFEDLNIKYYHDPNARTITPVKGASDKMYLATFPFMENKSNSQNTDMIRLYYFDSSTKGKIFDREVHKFYNLYGNGTDCGDPKITQREWWCGAMDSRISSGWIKDGKIGFLWGANKFINDKNSQPVPYIDGAIFDSNNNMIEMVSERPYLSNSLYTWGFADVAFNGNGDLGIIAFYGNKTTPTNLAFGVYNQNNNPHWKMMPLLKSTVPITKPVFDQIKCYADYQTEYPKLYQWGDYITINQYNNDDSLWEIAAFVTNGTNKEGKYTTNVNDVNPYYILVKK